MINLLWVAALSVLVLASVIGQFLAHGSGPIAAVTGFGLVVGGMLLAALVSHSREALAGAFATLRSLWRQNPDAGEEAGLTLFLQAADWYRRGDIRNAELFVSRIPGNLLRRGSRLILDGFPRDQVTRVLEWQIAEEREQERRHLELLKAMAGYAPAFGMLGTLLGLAQMLFGMSGSDLGVLGSSMGFAMLTTVYGLVLSNLILKPIAIKLEQRARGQLARRVAQLQAVLMFSDRQHSSLIREALETLTPGLLPQPAPAAAARTPPLRLVNAR